MGAGRAEVAEAAEAAEAAAAAGAAVVDSVLPDGLCEALAAVGRAVGYPADRPRALGAPLFGLAAARDPFLLPLVLARDLVRDAAEKALGLEGELAFEFTGLFTWLQGSKMGWHVDNGSGREDREVSAVVFLNGSGSAGEGGGRGDFSGGSFCFRGGTVCPRRGRLVAFRSSEEHCVEEVASGERCTLAVWFTRNSRAREDSRLLKLLLAPGPSLPLPLEMRLGLHNETREDVRFARLRHQGSLGRLPPGSESDLHLRILALERGGRVEEWRAYECGLSEAIVAALPRWTAMGELYWPDCLDPGLALLASGSGGGSGDKTHEHNAH